MKILIFSSENISDDIPDESNEEEIDVIFNSIKKELIEKNFIKKSRRNTDDFVFDFMKKLQMSTSPDDITTSNIPSILAKELSKYALPLVPSLPKLVSENDNIKTVKKFTLTTQNEENINGILYPFTPFLIKKYDAIKYKKIVIPKTIPYEILGFAIPYNLTLPIIDSSYFINGVFNDIRTTESELFLLNGGFGNLSKNTKLQNIYTNTFDGFSHMESTINENTKHEKLDDGKYKIIFFNDEQDSVKKMKGILSEIHRLNNYYAKTTYGMYMKNVPIPQWGKESKFDEKCISGENKIIFDIIDENIRCYSDSIFEALRYNNLEILGNTMKYGKQNIAYIRSVTEKLNYKKCMNKAILDQKKIIASYNNRISIKNVLSYRKFKKYNYFDLPKNQQQIIDSTYNVWKKNTTIDMFSEKKYQAIKCFYDAFMVLYPKKHLERALKMLKSEKLGLDASTEENLKYGLCEHSLTHAKLIINEKKDFEIKKILISDFAVSEIVLPEKKKDGITIDNHKNYQKPDYGYYCNICGALMYTRFAESNITFIDGRLKKTDNDDPLSDQIYKDVSFILRTSIRMADESLVAELKTLANSFLSVLRPKIGEIESTFLRAKTNENTNLKDIISLYTAIYTYALICKLIVTNNGNIVFAKTISGGKEMPEIRNLLSNAYYLIVTTKKNILENVATIDRKEIKPILINAYKWASSIAMVQEDISDTNESIQDLASIIMGDPFYLYLWKMLKFVNPNIDILDIKKILGRDLEEIDRDKEEKNIYATADITTSEQYINKIKSFPEIYKKNIIQYYYQSYNLITHYCVDSVYNETIIPMSTVMGEYYDKWESINESFIKLQMAKMIKYSTPIWVPNYNKYGNKYDNDPSLITLDLQKIYRKNGSLHEWDIFVFKSNNGSNKREFTQAELTEYLNSGKNIHKTHFLYDKKDSVTGEYLSSVKNYSADIIKNRKILYDIIGFFTYYENRCPVTDLHSMENGVCKKCGIVNSGRIKWAATKEGKKYYDKYYRIFLQDKKDLSSLDETQLADVVKNIRSEPKVGKKKLCKLHKETLILEWSRKIKAPFNALLNLGLSNDIKYDKIYKNQINPSKTASNDEFKVQAERLNIYYRDFLFNYYLIKNYRSIHDLPETLMELIKKNTTNVKNLQNSIPNLYDNEYLETYYAYLYSGQSYKNAAMYVLNIIAQSMLKILNVGKPFTKFAQALVEHFTKVMIYNDKLYSLPDPFKYVVDKQSEKKDSYASTDEDDEYEMSAESEDEEFSDMDDADDEFSLENSDILEVNRGED